MKIYEPIIEEVEEGYSIKQNSIFEAEGKIMPEVFSELEKNLNGLSCKLTGGFWNLELVKINGKKSKEKTNQIRKAVQMTFEAYPGTWRSHY